MVIEESEQLLRRKSQPAHSCFDLEVDWIGRRLRKSGFDQGGKDPAIADHRSELVSNQIGDLILKERTEYDNRSREAGLAEFDAFGKRGDGKTPDAHVGKRPHGFHRSMPVGIGLDDRHRLTAGGQVVLDAREIMGKGREIDGGVRG